jgi:hypothetical protein
MMHAVIPSIPNGSRTGVDDARGGKCLASVAGRAEGIPAKNARYEM